MSILFVKLIGCVTMLSAAATLTVSYKKSLDCIRFSAGDFLKFVRFAQNAVKYRSLPITRILEEYAEEAREVFKDFYYLSSKTSLAEALFTRRDLDEKTRSIMLAFSAEFGHGYADAEISLCELISARLSEHCALLDETASKKSAVFASAVAFVSVSLILLLI